MIIKTMITLAILFALIVLRMILLILGDKKDVENCDI